MEKAIWNNFQWPEIEQSEEDKNTGISGFIMLSFTIESKVFALQILF